MPHAVTISDLRRTAQELGLVERCLCVHSSLRSFGRVEGGPEAVLQVLLDLGNTVMVPTFTYECLIDPPPDPAMRPARNAWEYDGSWISLTGRQKIYRTQSNEVSNLMGAIPAALLRMPGRARGNHPICSFAAVGPMAVELIKDQRPLDVYAPLRSLAERDGLVVLMGVGLTRMTLVHLAENMAGRNLFRRWALSVDGKCIMAEFGGCSEGFEKLQPPLEHLTRRSRAGSSPWRVLPANKAVWEAAAIIRTRPEITRCTDHACPRCRDGIQGGPIL